MSDFWEEFEKKRAERMSLARAVAASNDPDRRFGVWDSRRWNHSLKKYVTTFGISVRATADLAEAIERGWARSEFSTLQSRPCAICARPFYVPRLGYGHGRSTVCSDVCHRAKESQALKARRSASKVPTPAILCPQCGENFTPARKDAKFCSVNCRVAAHRAKMPPT